MKEFLDHIKKFALLLENASVWHNSKEIIAPVFSEELLVFSEDNYIYEFYCYICVIVDLRVNYRIEFVPGSGKYKYKFPQAAAVKQGKPKFLAYQEKAMKFQICAGTKISCPIETENNHPDISFQLAGASDEPTHEDLIIILDAKFKGGKSPNLPKDEIYKFSLIVDLYNLRKDPHMNIEFNELVGLNGNCLITNGRAYSDSNNIQLLRNYRIKEVENFYPGKTFNVIG